MTFGERLKKARKEKGLTQRELAQLIGAKNNSVSNWEKDQNTPDGNKLILLIKALNTSAENLICYFDRNDLAMWEKLKNNNPSALTDDQKIALEYANAASTHIWKQLDADDSDEFDAGSYEEQITQMSQKLNLLLKKWGKKPVTSFDFNEVGLLNDYRKLNDKGQQRLRDYLNELLMLALYTQKDGDI